VLLKKINFNVNASNTLPKQSSKLSRSSLSLRLSVSSASSSSRSSSTSVDRSEQEIVDNHIHFDERGVSDASRGICSNQIRDTHTAEEVRRLKIQVKELQDRNSRLVYETNAFLSDLREQREHFISELETQQNLIQLKTEECFELELRREELEKALSNSPEHKKKIIEVITIFEKAVDL
jgi:hypothetical protein